MYKRIAVLVAAGLMLTPIKAQASDISESMQDSCIWYAEQYGIEPELIMAIIEAESSGDIEAENGPCKGLMQVNAELHSERLNELGITDIWNADSNIHAGVDILAELIEKYEEVSIALDKYNGNPAALKNFENGTLSRYANKVLRRSIEIKNQN